MNQLDRIEHSFDKAKTIYGNAREGLVTVQARHDGPTDAPRTRVLVEDAPTPAPDSEGSLPTPEENNQVRALLRVP